MANYDNIKDYGFDKIPPERQREIARKGAAAATEARKKKKTMKEIFQAIGELAVPDDKLRKKMAEVGLKDEEMTWKAAVAVSAILNAIKKQDPKAVEFVLEMMDSDEGAKLWVD